MVSSHGQFSITNSLLTLTMQNPLISTVTSYQNVNLNYQRDSSTCPCDCSEWSRAMECAPSYVAGALLRGDQRRRPIPASILLKPTCVDTPEFQPLESGVFCMTKCTILAGYAQNYLYVLLFLDILYIIACRCCAYEFLYWEVKFNYAFNILATI